MAEPVTGLRRSLYAKLALVLLGLFAVVGTLYLALTVYATRRHLEEVNQRLNRGLASNLVKEQLPLREGEIDEGALEEIFHIMMVINPQIELYLLDPDGGILAYSAPEGVVKRDRVALDPIRDFLASDRELPILGDDPRDPGGRKIFSVAPIFHERAGVSPTSASAAGTPGGRALQGYLYVVLAAEDYASAVSMLEGSYILRLSSGLMLASLAFTLVAGLVLFHLSTRRLRRVAAAMEGFRASGFRRALPPGESLPPGRGDEIDQISGAFQEMSERITAQMAELEQTDRLRRELVANVSHDLRTPLASLHGYLETLAVKQGRLTPEEEREYLAIATRHSERLGKLVSELFELTKLDASDTELTLERFSLAELVQDVVQDYRLRAEERGVELAVTLERASGLVEADIRLVERALVNFIENAIKFTPRGGKVTVSVVGHPRGLQVEVRDTGCGIPAEELPFVFERFYRTEKGREDGGSGLGLAIARRVLELHGSAVEVASTLGEGTVFRFEMSVVEAA